MEKGVRRAGLGQTRRGPRGSGGGSQASSEEGRGAEAVPALAGADSPSLQAAQCWRTNSAGVEVLSSEWSF